MKKLIILLLAVTLASCEKDESARMSGATVEGVTFSKATVGSRSNIRVRINLSMPEPGSVVRIDARRGTSRFTCKDNPVDGMNEFIDNVVEWPYGVQRVEYVLFLIHADGTETTHGPYTVSP